MHSIIENAMILKTLPKNKEDFVILAFKTKVIAKISYRYCRYIVANNT